MPKERWANYTRLQLVKEQMQSHAAHKSAGIFRIGDNIPIFSKKRNALTLLVVDPKKHALETILVWWDTNIREKNASTGRLEKLKAKKIRVKVLNSINVFEIPTAELDPGAMKEPTVRIVATQILKIVPFV